MRVINVPIGIALVALLIWGTLASVNTINGLRADSWRRGRWEGVDVGYNMCLRDYGNLIYIDTQLKMLAREYGGNLQDVPWDKFSIRQKMFLCAYGSPGNRFGVNDVQELMDEFGPQNWELSFCE